jgi:hypothetical protein
MAISVNQKSHPLTNFDIEEYIVNGRFANIANHEGTMWLALAGRMELGVKDLVVEPRSGAPVHRWGYFS